MLIYLNYVLYYEQVAFYLDLVYIFCDKRSCEYQQKQLLNNTVLRLKALCPGLIIISVILQQQRENYLELNLVLIKLIFVSKYYNRR